MSLFHLRGIWREIWAEFLGTLALVIFGIGIGFQFEAGDERTFDEKAFSFGLVVYFIGEAIAWISGSDINPCFTVVWVLVGQMSILRGISYILAQFFGALCGLLILKFLLTPGMKGTLLIIPPSYMTPTQTFWTVFIYSAYLLITMNCLLDKKENIKGGSVSFHFGLALTGMFFSGGRWGLGLNPTRALTSFLLENEWPDNFWIYLVGPMSGAISGSLLYLKMWRKEQDKVHPSIEVEDLERRIRESGLAYSAKASNRNNSLNNMIREAVHL